MPIFDRYQFCQNYVNDNSSMFLLQAILTQALAYAPLSVLNEAGYSDRPTAAKTFYERARLLYDFGMEKSPLIIVQACALLHVSYLAVKTERDYRFWLSLATRVATQMGMHKEATLQTINPVISKLFRRIWHFLCYRDIQASCAGFKHARHISEDDCDVQELDQSEWVDEPETMPHHDLLPPLSRLQKLHFVHLVKFSRIGKHQSMICYGKRLTM